MPAKKENFTKEDTFLENMIKPKKAALEAGEAFLDKALSTCKSLQGFTYVRQDGSLYMTDMQAPCYGSLARAHGNSEYIINDPLKNPIVIFADYALPWRHQGKMAKGDLTNELAIEFLDWLANKSLFARAYISKDAEQILHHGALFNTAYPLRFLLHAAMSIRYVAEHPAHVVRWKRHCEYFSPDLAWGAAHFFSHDYKYTPYGVGHGLFNDMTLKGWARYIQGDFSLMNNPKVHLPTFQCPVGYRSLASIWNEDQALGAMARFVEKFSEASKPNSWSGDVYYRVVDKKNVLPEFEKQLRGYNG